MRYEKWRGACLIFFQFVELLCLKVLGFHGQEPPLSVWGNVSAWVEAMLVDARVMHSDAGWWGKLIPSSPPSRVCRRLWGQPNSHEATIGQIAFFPPLRPAQIVKYHVRGQQTPRKTSCQKDIKVKYKWGSSLTVHRLKISVYLSFDHSKKSLSKEGRKLNCFVMLFCHSLIFSY